MKCIVHALNSPGSTIRTICIQRGKVLKAEVTVGSSSHKVVSFSWQLVRGKWKDSCLSGQVAV